jgi:hypothetical protein
VQESVEQASTRVITAEIKKTSNCAALQAEPGGVALGVGMGCVAREGDVVAII